MKVLPPERGEEDQEGKEGDTPETRFPGSIKAAHRARCQDEQLVLVKGEDEKKSGGHPRHEPCMSPVYFDHSFPASGELRSGCSG